MEDRIEEFDYTAQQMLVQFHMTPAEYDQQNFYRWNEVMAARSAEDRPPIDPSWWLKQGGSTEGGITDG